MEKFWNKAVELMSRDELYALQTKRLQQTVQRVYTSVSYYRAKMQAIGILPGDIKEAKDVSKLPFTTKTDLRDTYPYGMFAAPLEEIVRIHASSGTTGKQTVVGYTARDLEYWSELMARCFGMTGAGKHSGVQVCYGYGLFTGGLGAHYGGERIGASVVPASSGNTSRQITMLKDFGSTVLCCTPSYALFIAETMREMGLTKGDLKLEAGIFGAEPWTNNMRIQIEESLGLKAFDIYGLSEIMGPSVSQECEHQNGLHIWEDAFIPEIIDGDGNVLGDGVSGELVFTTITKEGFPLIRYRTRDISSLNYEKCACGRSHVRMSKPDGRSDDMLIIRGVNVFPSQIESVLLEVDEATPHYQIIVDRVGQLDTLTVEVEVSEKIFEDYVKGLESLEKKIRVRIESILGVACKVRLVEPKAIVRSEGKAKRVIDNRKI